MTHSEIDMEPKNTQCTSEKKGIRVLYLTTVLPSSEKTGGEIATQNFVGALQYLGCYVKLLGYARDRNMKPLEHERLIADRPIESRSAPLTSLLWLFKSFFSGLPYTVTKFIGRDYLRAVSEELAAQYDLIVVEHTQMGWLIKHLGGPYKIAFNVQNVENILYEDLSKKASSSPLRLIYKREKKILQDLENKWAKEADMVWTLTKSDARYFSHIVGNLGKVLTFGLPGPVIEKTTLENDHAIKRDIAILGTWTWNANAEGLIWFVEEVLPHLDSDIRISVAGSGADDILSEVKGIEYLGFVPSSVEFLLSSAIVCIPTTQGGGIQIKSIESLSLGMPVVATSVAMRGIEDVPNWVYCGDSAEEFADNISRALIDQSATRADGTNWAINRQQEFLASLQACLSTVEVS